MNIPKENEIYRHFKGQLYSIVTVAEHSETGEKLVIYKAMYGEGKVYARPLDMFMSPVDKAKYPDAQQEYRFEKADNVKAADGSDVKAEVSAGTATDEDREVMDPKVDEFIMADTYEKKLEILYSMKNSLTDEKLNMMAMTCEVTLGEGSVEEKYESLKKALLIYEKYECNRLR